MRALLALLLLAPLASAQTARVSEASSRAGYEPGVTAYVGGAWYDGERFVPRDTMWADRGVFATRPLAPEADVRTVDLSGRFVVPPYGDAHYHGFETQDGLAAADSEFVALGVFYVQNPNNRLSDRVAVRGTETTVDVAYANGGVTAPGAHPVPAYERQALGLTIQEMWDRADEMRESRLLEGDAYHLAATVADVDRVWPRILSGEPDVVKVYLSNSEEWAAGAPEAPRGLSPAVVAEIVRRAHAAGLRVVAHVETSADVRAALDANVDALAHVPGYSSTGAPEAAYSLDDALAARLATQGVAVTPTFARGPAQLPFVPERYRPSAEMQAVGRQYHRDVLQRLVRAGVPLALGADLGSLTSRDEADYAVEIGGLSPTETLHALSVSTPQAIFPSRAIGSLAEGFEASLLALACDPTADWACAGQIAHREKGGVPIGLVPLTHRDTVTTAYVGGRWFDGERFAPRDTTWASGGVFVDAPLAPEARVVNLGERYIVPPFGDAHTHMLADGYTARFAQELFADRGILYALVLGDDASGGPRADLPAGLDVALAHGGITSTGSHPAPLYERLARNPNAASDAARSDTLAWTQHRRAYWFMDTPEAIDAEWNAYLATEPDVVKLYLTYNARCDDRTDDRNCGLSPEALREIVRRAREAGLPVFAHVNTRDDVRRAVAAGVDALAHIPSGNDGIGTGDPRFWLDRETIAQMASGGVTAVATSSLLFTDVEDVSADTLQVERARQRAELQALHGAGVPLALGADQWRRTSAFEADYLAAGDVFEPATLLDLWSRVTPQSIFPGRAIGRLAPGYEASFLALDCDPTEAWACTRQLSHTEKEGARLGTRAEPASGARGERSGAALRYTLTIEPENRRVVVDALWAGGVLADVDRWATGTGADSASVAEAEATSEGVRFSYALTIPAQVQENSVLPSLSGRRLRAWHWDVLRYPMASGAPPEGTVSLEYAVRAGWHAATAFGDAAESPANAPSLDAALRSPVLAGDLRLIEVQSGTSTSRLAVRAGHPVPDSVFALGFRRLVETVDAYVGGLETPEALFAIIDLLEGKPSRIPGNFAASPEAAAFIVLQHDNDPSDPGFWGTIAHEYLHGWTPVAFSRTDPAPAPVEGRLWPWFREGLTNYLGYQIAHQAGLLSNAEWTEAATTYVREYETVAASDPITGSRAYSEGFVIGLALDAALARETDGERRLREWFGLLLQRHTGKAGTPITLLAMRRAVAETGGAPVAALFDRLVSEDPATVRATLAETLRDSGLRIEASGDGPRIVLGPNGAALFEPLGGAEAHRAFRQRLQRAYDAAAPFDYPILPSAPIVNGSLSDFARGLAAPAGGAWAPFFYGEGSDATATVEGGALRVAGQAGPSFTGAGVELRLGTPDETTDLSAFDGVELTLDVREGPLALHVASSTTSRRDRPTFAIGPTDGVTTLRVPWSAFSQRTPVAKWFRDATALRLLVSGQGEKATVFTLYGARLYRAHASG